MGHLYVESVSALHLAVLVPDLDPRPTTAGRFGVRTGRYESCIRVTHQHETLGGNSYTPPASDIARSEDPQDTPRRMDPRRRPRQPCRRGVRLSASGLRGSQAQAGLRLLRHEDGLRTVLPLPPGFNRSPRENRPSCGDAREQRMCPRRARTTIFTRCRGTGPKVRTPARQEAPQASRTRGGSPSGATASVCFRRSRPAPTRRGACGERWRRCCEDTAVWPKDATLRGLLVTSRKLEDRLREGPGVVFSLIGGAVVPGRGFRAIR
ncbi:hypothetical protein PHLGIDRAFT_232755 [Phlebiopsis gigantea 11061_1 CR5-6]|uniref:Uncharacterized protein n=1 Tax=Phlebiopsis gigantea (strain 11061_1 CR5-6) TaxID=745531 RepID=A0A0C3PSW6_PHLG1|nr:hypothetical protein PHLGIDRAFT_232755 [Phlebiopsis gigantea 11061_1 CR5-6]